MGSSTHFAISLALFVLSIVPGPLTNTITNSMANPLMQTTGSVNADFMNEIGQLVRMFSQVSMNEVLGPASTSGV